MGSSDGRSGSLRRGKKNTSDKPKQPQRGLGVAQLEKIRLQNQMIMAGYLLNKEDPRVQMAYPTSPSSSTITTSSSPYVLPPNYNMANFGDHVATDMIRYADPYSSAATRTLHECGSTIILPPHYYEQQRVTLPLLDQNMEINRRQDWCNGSISHFSTRETPEPDLELRLSL